MLNNRKEFKEIFAIQPLDGSRGRIELGEARFDWGYGGDYKK
ncbi:MAG: hypothetical protein OCU24_02025 [Candidatus Methanospirare jalkutatii]|nr:hypothetical protein [Candidatus Methanospirare jalkutatii]